MKANLVAAALVASLAAGGCGQMKNKDEKLLVVRDQAVTSTSSDGLSANLDQIRQFIELYFGVGGGSGMSREQLAHLLERYKDKLGEFLSGSKLSLNDLLDLLFKFDHNRDGKLTPGEIADGLLQRVPILRWIPSNVAQVSEAELADKIASEYPQASPKAREGLTKALMIYDQPWAGGNGDGLLTRIELSSAGLILGMLQSTDFSQPIAVPSNPRERLVGEQLNHKINQQIFGRHEQLDYMKLAPADIQLEWMQLSMRFYLTDKLVHFFGGTEGRLPSDRQAMALSALGPAQQPHWEKLRRFYDNPMMGGDRDGKLSTIESFSLLSDLEFAQKLLNALEGDTTAAGINRAPAKRKVLASLMTLLPRVGQPLAMGDLDEWKKDPWAVRAEFWNSLRLYDEREYGGNGDGKLDAGELAMALGYARVVENLYAVYDTGRDGYLSKEEARPLFAELGVHDGRLIDAFFMNVGLDGHDVGFWEKLKIFFSGRSKIDNLHPYEFYERLVKVMPRILDEKGFPLPQPGPQPKPQPQPQPVPTKPQPPVTKPGRRGD
ncbi:MAG: hypothetical protein HY075_10175 [Deltaproteobacteria bacterium]|nr:hypothetical protein [Deltaproteobacteria bacterium]